MSKWAPGTAYAAGAVVVPTALPASTNTPVTNGGFESGDTGWTKGSGWAINNTAAFAGDYSAAHTATGEDVLLVNDQKAAVTPGQSVTARCMVYGTTSAEDTASVVLRWYDADANHLSDSTGNTVGGATVWRESRVTATAPSGAAKVSIACITTKATSGTLRADAFTWNHVAPGAGSEFAYEATVAGTSGATEPTWPTTLDDTVTDGGVTWKAIAARTVTWEASPILVSGDTEPDWPIEPDAFVSDGTIAWKAVPFRITDPNCPHGKTAAIGASKVFAGDGDVTRFSATLDARDWSSTQDAGFIGTGLQQKGLVDVTAMGMYRGNLCVWSPSTFQMWQIDPDPAAMALMDAIEGIGTSHHRAVQAVSNDLFFLPALGVRTVGLSAGSGQLMAGDVGLPIDPLVQAAVAGKEPIATFYPSAGQFWLTTANEPAVPQPERIPLLCPLLADAWVGTEYSYTPDFGDTEGVTFEITDGALPPGLTLDEISGEISGTPTEEGEYDFILTATAPGWASALCQHRLIVQKGEWWLTSEQYSSPQGRLLWVSDDALTWTVQTSRSPFVVPYIGAHGITTGLALVPGHTAVERHTSFDYAAPLVPETVSVESDAGRIRVIAVGDLGANRVIFIQPRANVAKKERLYYSMDDGETWSTCTPAGPSGQVGDICRVGSRWVSSDTGASPKYFTYSDALDPATGWTTGQNNSDMSGQGGWIMASNGSVAVSCTNWGDYYRTTDGATWSKHSDPLSLGGAYVDLRDAIAVGDVFLFTVADEDLGSGTYLLRSDDAGLTWAKVTVNASTAHTITRLAYGGGRIVASVAGANMPYVSTDLGLTWTQGTAPVSFSFGDSIFAAFIWRTGE